MKNLSRTPPVDIRRQLRQEVGFGCPVEGCGNPYLEYHHFNPSWATKQHHNPEGMVALCHEHHAKADAWTIEQTTALKKPNLSRIEVTGRIEWMRQDILAIVGGNYYYETENILVLNDQNSIWFERDEDNHLLLNVFINLPGEQPKTILQNNDWIVLGNPDDVDSPPNGSLLEVKYPDGDYIRLKFKNYVSPESLFNQYTDLSRFSGELTFPLVTAELTMKIGAAGIELGTSKTTLPGNITFTGNFVSGPGTAFSIELPSNGTQAIQSILQKYDHLLS